MVTLSYFSSVESVTCPVVPSMKCGPVSKPYNSTETKEVCEDITKNECGEPTLVRTCSTVTKEQCVDEPKHKCKPEEVCQDFTEEECRMETETVYDVIVKEKCVVEMEEKCHQVPKMECKEVTNPEAVDCVDVPAKVCVPGEKEECSTTTSQVCSVEYAPDRECKQRMKKVCTPVPTPDCKQVMKFPPFFFNLQR